MIRYSSGQEIDFLERTRVEMVKERSRRGVLFWPMVSLDGTVRRVENQTGLWKVISKANGGAGSGQSWCGHGESRLETPSEECRRCRGEERMRRPFGGND